LKQTLKLLWANFYGRNAYATIAQHLQKLNPKSTDNCMVGYHLKNTLSDNGYVSRGQCTSDENNYLIDVIERTHIEKTKEGIFFENEQKEQIKLAENTLVSMNFWGFTPTFFTELQNRFPLFLKANKEVLKAEFFIPTVVNELIAEKKSKTKVLESEASWFGVTYQEDRPTVIKSIRKLIKNGDYPAQLWT